MELQLLAKQLKQNGVLSRSFSFSGGDLFMPCIAGFLVLIIALFLLVIVAVAIVTALGALGIGGASAFAVTKYKKRQFELAAKEVNKNLLPSQPQTASKEKVITPSRKYPVESKVQNPPKQPSKKEAYKWMEQD